MSSADFAEFYAGTADAVRNRADALAGDRQVALDATQEAYARMLERWPRRCSHSTSDNQAYTMVIARNLVTDWFRYNARIDRWRDENEEICVEDEAMDALLDEASLLKSVRELVDRLPKRQRMVAMLYFFEDCRCGEIADMLGIAPSTVRTHIERVRIRLKRHVARMAELQEGGDS